ncbi:SemiSWEET family transporter [Leuconostoc citreum]
MKKESDFTKKLSWTATIMSVMMYVSYIPQIFDNLAGHHGSPIQPLVAAINCTLWVTYALVKKNTDLPLAAANFPGIIFGIITFWTAL